MKTMVRSAGTPSKSERGTGRVGLKRVCFLGHEPATVRALGKLLGRDFYLIVSKSTDDFLSTLHSQTRLDGVVVATESADFERIRLVEALRAEQPHLPVFVFASSDPVSLPDPISKLVVQRFFRKPREILKLAESLHRELGPAREGSSASIIDARSRIVGGAIKYVEENLLDIEDSTDVSRHLGVTREHLSREFARYTGYTLWEFVNLCRIERAKELLGESRLLVKQIFSEAGFHSESSFFRAFAKYSSLTPERYRKSLPGG